MEELFFVYRIYPLQSLWGVFIGIFLPFALSHLNRWVGIVSGALLAVAGSTIIIRLGGGVWEIYGTVFIPALIGWGTLLFFFPPSGKSVQKKESDIMRVELLDEKRKSHWISDLNRGVAIFGSSGAGKSASVIFFLMQHLSKHKFAGIINDYKDYELTEIAYPLFDAHGVRFRVFAIHDVNRSVRINILDPKYIRTMTDVSGIVSSLVLNLSQSESDSGTEKFFRDGAESLMCGVIWRLKKDYPEKCNLPFLIALLLSTENHHEEQMQPNGTLEIKPFAKLIRFICQDPEAEVAASVFLSGAANERQTGALYSTLAASLRKLASPEIFYLLEESDIDLDLNSQENRTVLSFVNMPGAMENVISPINAMLIEGCFTAMSKRERQPSFILLDEAPTIKIMGLGRRIATLRSYGVSFIYYMQDKVQGMAQWGGRDYKIKEILTNLSTQFMGKANDADTSKYYEKFFELVKEDQKSVSRGKSSWFTSANRGDIRETVSQREKSKVRAYEFFQLRQGEFIMFADGKDDKFRFYYEPPKKALPTPHRYMTDVELQENFSRILTSAKEFLT